MYFLTLSSFFRSQVRKSLPLEPSQVVYLVLPDPAKFPQITDHFKESKGICLFPLSTVLSVYFLTLAELVQITGEESLVELILSHVPELPQLKDQCNS
jgi:hypothetical protein